ncbi:hypothetical protein ES703_20995 [subsurface metagenome]|nr:TonB-dependent receptor plug domain-containing protein [Dehalococcoidia bacterium]
MKLVLLFCLLPVLALSQTAATISGFVTDVESGEALAGANVYLQDLDLGAAANLDGYYVINNVPPGRRTLRVGYIGYTMESIEITIGPGQAVRQDVEMSPEVLTGRTIEVFAEREKFQREISVSRVSVSPTKLRTLPQVGEVDLFRAIQMLPGVRAQSEFSSGLIVRGGNTDQNLILFDGVTVYNPSHLGGVFSTFITEGLREAELAKGAYPAEFGGRLSSVLDIHSKDGNSKRFSGSAEISLIASKALIEGPLHKGGWLLTGRRTYIDQVLKLLNSTGVIDFELPYYFYDLQGNLYQNFGENDRVSLSLYKGDDKLDWPDILASINWGNQTASVRWRHLFSTRLISTFLVANSRFATNLAMGGSDGMKSNNHIKDITTKGDLTYFYMDNRLIKFGFELKDLDIRYLATFDVDTSAYLHQKPLQTAFYFSDKWNSHRWVVQYGLRLNYFDDASDKITLSPRFSAKYLLNDISALNLSLGRYYQYIFTINTETSFQTPINNWIAQDKSVPVQYSDQVVLGFEIQKHSYNLSFEAYAKTMHNLLVYRVQMAAFDEQVLGGAVSDIFQPTKAASWGMELFGEKTRGRLTGNLGYTLSWVVKQIEDEPKYWANWDRRHELKTSASWRFSEKWMISSTFQLGNGYPYTRMLGTYVYYEPGFGEGVTITTIPGTRNNARLPAYHRMDVSLTRSLAGKRIKGEWYINIINLYNHRNVLAVFWDTDELKKGVPAVKNELKMFPIIPSLGIRISF